MVFSIMYIHLGKCISVPVDLIIHDNSLFIDTKKKLSTYIANCVIVKQIIISTLKEYNACSIVQLLCPTYNMQGKQNVRLTK